MRNLKSPGGYVTRVIHTLIMHGMALVGLAEKGPRGAELTTVDCQSLFATGHRQQ